MTKRIPSIDALRGLIMIIMALDHVRDFYHRQAIFFQPDDLAHTTPAIFFTRWITHFCAPVFMTTAGLAAYLWSRGHGVSTRELSKFLWTRGLWLAFLELTVLRFAMFFSLTSGPVLLTILWALGWSMVTLSVLVYLPLRVLAPFSIAVIVLHNLADPITSSSAVWKLLHQGGFFTVAGIPVVAGYPLIPWFAVMAAGFCFGPVMDLSPEKRRRVMRQLGLGMTIAFLIVRGINIYGDPRPWEVGSSPVMTLLSFLRCNKYPPSLDFLLMTLGPALLVLSLFDERKFAKLNPLMVFGKTPLFFFLVHMFVIHFLAAPLAAIRYGRVAFLINPLPTLGGDMKLYPAGYGYTLGEVYLIWIVVLVLLYPLCVWFMGIKQRRNSVWLRYL